MNISASPSHMDAARRWAEAHPTETVELHVVGARWPIAGQRAATPRVIRFRFIVHRGEVAPVITHYWQSVRQSNGMCELCGTIHFDPALTQAYAPNPDVGRLVSVENGMRTVAGDFVRVDKACPHCIAKHDLTTGWVPRWQHGGGNIFRHNHPHPEATHYIGTPIVIDMDREPKEVQS